MTLIPEGTWRGRGVTAVLGYTSQDNPQVGVELALAPDQDDDVDGRHITWYGQFSEKAEQFTLKTLRTLGWAGDDISDLSGIDANEVDVVIAHEQDLQGEWRARVRFVNPIGSGGVAMKNKMTAEQAKAFAERYRGKVLAMNKGASDSAPKTTNTAPPKATPARQTKRAASAAPQVQPPEDDDISF